MNKSQYECSLSKCGQLSVEGLVGVTWVKAGVCTENPARTTGLEKRVMSAAERNGMIMLVYFLLYKNKREGREGRKECLGSREDK